MPTIVILSVVIPSDIVLSVVMLSVIMPSDVILSILSPTLLY